MVPVEQGGGKVEPDSHPLARVAPHQEEAKVLVLAREGQGPAVVAISVIEQGKEGSFMIGEIFFL